MNIKGALPLLILHVLSYGDRHGYEINMLICSLSDGELCYKEGTLYPTLHQLEKDGFVSSYRDENDGRRRRYYTITQDGRGSLSDSREAWAAYTDAVNLVLASVPPTENH